MRTGRIIGFICGFLFLDISISAAHGVTVFAWVEGDTVYVESKFSGGRKPINAPLEVYDSGGKLLLKGQTNNQGEFSFKVPQRTEMKIILIAGMGHKAEWTIPVEDLGEIDRSREVDEEPKETGGPKQLSGTAPQHQPEEAASAAPSTAIPGLSAADIQTAVENALDKKLKPVLKMLADSRRRGPSINDILGGIGYILGLIGLAAYIRYRRKKADRSD